MRVFSVAVLGILTIQLAGCARGVPKTDYHDSGSTVSQAKTSAISGCSDGRCDSGDASPGNADLKPELGSEQTADAADSTAPAAVDSVDVTAQGDSTSALGSDQQSTPAPDLSQADSLPSGAPLILQLSANLTRMTEADTLVVHAVVTASPGSAAVLSGTLNDPDTGTSYGSFVPGQQPGSYSISLSWTAVAQVHALYTGEEGVSRTFAASFYTVDGELASASVSVVLACQFVGYRTCGFSNCVDVMTDPAHCGTCDNPVPEQTFCQLASITGESGMLCDGDWQQDSVERCGACRNDCARWAKQIGLVAEPLGGATLGCGVQHCELAADRPVESASECAAQCAGIGATCDRLVARYGDCGEFVQNSCQLDPPGETTTSTQSCPRTELRCHCVLRRQTDDERLKTIAAP